MSQTPATRDVLLVAAELNDRRLLLGELLEAGYSVMPTLGVPLAIGLLLQHLVEPRLILVDVQGDHDASPQSVVYLTSLRPEAASIVVVGAIERSIWEPERVKFSKLLCRPITIGAIVETVKDLLHLKQRK